MCLIPKIGRIIAFLVLFCQIISVTISYFEYETVIDMKAVANEEQRPTFSFCLKNKDKFIEKNLKYFSISFDHPIGCARVYESTQYVNCSKFTRIVESVTTHSRKCFSYFSRLFDENFSPENKGEFAFLIQDNMKAFALIHQSLTPPHFFNDKAEIPKSSYIVVDYSSINTILLPFSHSTNCLDNKREEKQVIRYKSREDCFVKHLERRELTECGCNKRWSYRRFRFRNFSNICPKTVKCRFDSILELKTLEKIFRKNCLNQYFFNFMSSSKYNEEYTKDMISFFIPYKMAKIEIKFSHLPKMNLVEYFCSVGGLISMWFGISVYYLVLIFMRETNNRIFQLFRLIKFKMILKFKNLISHKKIFSNTIIIIFSVLMLYLSYINCCHNDLLRLRNCDPFSNTRNNVNA
jgi:hypothetical protein